MGAAIPIGGNGAKWYGVGSPNGLYPPGGGPGAYVSSPGSPSGITQPYATALSQAPAATPDLTDKMVQAARSSQSLTAGLRQGRRTTFLSGPEGLGLSPPTVGSKTALGG